MAESRTSRLSYSNNYGESRASGRSCGESRGSGYIGSSTTYELPNPRSSEEKSKDIGDIRKQVIQELYDEFYGEIKEEVKKELQQEKPQIISTVKEEIKDEVKRRLKADVKDSIIKGWGENR